MYRLPNFNGIFERQNSTIRKGIDRQNKQLSKAMTTMKLSISKEGRVRIPAKRRHEVEEKYNHRCAVCKEKPHGITLQIHHKNMKNNDNRLSNLELLCPNHHIQRHSKAFRRVYYKPTLLGVKKTTRLIKKKPKVKIKKRRTRQSTPLTFKVPKFNLRI